MKESQFLFSPTIGSNQEILLSQTQRPRISEKALYPQKEVWNEDKPQDVGLNQIFSCEMTRNEDEIYNIVFYWLGLLRNKKNS